MSPTTDLAAPLLTDPPGAVEGWTRVCHLDRIVADTGVAALADGSQVAVFRLYDGRVYAVANHDPCSGANVLARGIVGDVAGEPYVASPIHKQRFELGTGRCLDEEDVRIDVRPVRIVDGYVEVGAPTS